MAMHLQEVMKQAGHALPAIKPILEVNPDHPLVTRLKEEQDEAKFADWSHLLFEQALLSEGGHLEDPTVFVKRMNAILVELSNH
jgi:molecular chaperone HtpG